MHLTYSVQLQLGLLVCVLYLFLPMETATGANIFSTETPFSTGLLGLPEPSVYKT